MASVPDPSPVCDLVFYKGDTWDFPSFVHKDEAGNPIDFTGKEIRVVVRKQYGDADPPVLSLDTASGGAVITAAAAGTWRFDAASTQTGSIAMTKPSQLFYYTATLYTPGSSPEYDRVILRGALRVNAK